MLSDDAANVFRELGVRSLFADYVAVGFDFVGEEEVPVRLMAAFDSSSVQHFPSHV